MTTPDYLTLAAAADMLARTSDAITTPLLRDLAAAVRALVAENERLGDG